MVQSLAQVQVLGCRLLNNSAQDLGGAIRVHTASLSVYGCRIDRNVATRGGAVNLNCTFDHNAATASGGAIFARTETSIPALLTVRNSILWNNRAPLNPQLFGPSADVSYCDVRGGWPGPGNIDADPLFEDVAGRRYRTQDGSPAHDAGSNAGLLFDLMDLDGDGGV